MGGQTVLRDMALTDPLTRGEKRKLTGLRASLLAWADDAGRDFPWRGQRVGIYEKIAVEVLLQRTTATAVARFYESFFSRFPDWHVLAAAEPADLEQFLRPLGLWRRRATSLLGLARYAAAHNGQFSPNPDQHRDVPAVGQYVSNAIMLFQHGHSAPLLDVNMARVIERFVRPRILADIRYDPWLQAAAHWYVRGARTAEVNWAILDFAAKICKARRPLCEVCPVNSRCTYFRSLAGRVALAPEATP